MGRCGIAAIDDLFEARGQATIGPGSDPEAVGEIQDFLRCQGFGGLPGLLGSGRGKFGPKTCEAVRNFRAARNLGEGEMVDSAVLHRLVEEQAGQPVASRAYLGLVLDMEFSGMLPIVALTSQFESGQRFGCMCLNTDRAGLSFGLIQWAQRPGRLHEILAAFNTADPAAFVEVFGGGDASVAGRLLELTAQPSGGVDPATGQATDPAFDLIAPPWTERFKAAAIRRDWQRTQCETAIADFSGTWARLGPQTPRIRSNRGVAFLLDLANQHGEGGARSIYRAVGPANKDESELLLAMAEESVKRVRKQFGPGSAVARATRARRDFFCTTTALSDLEFA
jgi:peptidoglycan hydrolase-like protein with peptidoglycan-binding domain